MFAIALWDRARERLVLARDRVGKKPLLYVSLAGRLARLRVGAEGAAPAARRSARARPRALDAYLALQYVPGVETGVRRDPPARRRDTSSSGRTARSGRSATGRSSPSRATCPTTSGSSAYETTVRDAVRRRLVSDVPLGALLSGGIDSTIVVGLMAQASTRPVRTFTVGVHDPRYDERAAARVAASASARVHEELLVEPDPVELVSQLTSFARRAARRRGHPAHVSHLAGRAAARHGRADGRRRRRVLRGIRALRGDADRRSNRRDSRSCRARRARPPRAPRGAAPARARRRSGPRVCSRLRPGRRASATAG